MDAPISEDAALLVTGARRRLNELRRRIATVADSSANREEETGVRLVIETCRQLIAGAERFVSRTEYELGLEPDLAIDHLRSIRTGIDAVHRAIQIDLDYLSRPALLDAEPLVRPFIRLAKLLTGPLDSELIFSAQDIDRYRVWPDAFTFAKANVKSFSRREAIAQGIQRLPTVAFITYPSYADDNTFQHAVMAHEVAHLALVKPLEKLRLARLDDLFEVAFAEMGGITAVRPGTEIPSTEAAPEPGHDAASAETSSGRVGRRQPTEDLRRTSGESAEEVAARLKSWFDELVCDQIALRTIGPAYFFALIDYVLPRAETRALPEGEQFRTHPPLTWRLRQLVPATHEYIVSNVGEAQEKIQGVFEQYVRLIELHDQLEGAMEHLDPQEEKLLVLALTKVTENIDDAVGEAIFSADDFERDIPLVWDKLAYGIAPVERVSGRSDASGHLELPLASGDDGDPVWSEPVDWRAILNGGFFFFASGASAEGPLSVGGSPAQQRVADCRILRGSIELSEVLCQMLDLKAQFSVLNPP